MGTVADGGSEEAGGVSDPGPEEERRRRLKVLRESARELNRKGEWGAEALEVNAEISRLDPADLAALARYARAARTAGDLEEARIAYESARELDPDNQNVAAAIRSVEQEAAELLKRSWMAEREGAHGTALLENLQGCDEALELARRVRAGERGGPDFEYTVKAYRRALELDESRVGIAVEMAAFIRRSGSSARAIRIYDRILELWPEYDSALVGKAAALLDAGRIREAIGLCERVVERTLDEPHARKVLARAHALRGSREESLWNWYQAGE